MVHSVTDRQSNDGGTGQDVGTDQDVLSKKVCKAVLSFANAAINLSQLQATLSRPSFSKAGVAPVRAIAH